jgi:hypothetical protein
MSYLSIDVHVYTCICDRLRASDTDTRTCRHECPFKLAGIVSSPFLTSKLRVGVGEEPDGDQIRFSRLSYEKLQCRAYIRSPVMSQVIRALDVDVCELCGLLDEFRQTSPQSLRISNLYIATVWTSTTLR